MLLGDSKGFLGGLVISFLIMIANIVGCRRIVGTSSVSVVGFFFFFLSLFYAFRGLAIVIYDEGMLAVKLGVVDLDVRLSEAIGWVNIFAALMGMTYAACALKRVKMTGFLLKKVSGLSSHSPRGEPSRNGLLAFVSLFAGLLLAFGLLLGGQLLNVEGQFAITAPLGFGFCLAGIAYFVSFQTTTHNLPKFAIALVLVLVFTFFTKNTFSARLYSIGLPALLVAYFLGHYRLYYSVMLGMLVFQPVLQGFGENRSLAANEIVGAVAAATEGKLGEGPMRYLAYPYTEASGDFTALDVFASALNGQQEFRPWGLSVPYALIHWIPRSWWESKPIDGFLTDEASFRTARAAFESKAGLIPYDPGIVGNLYLEGSYPFIVLGAILLGLLAWQLEVGLQFIMRNGVGRSDHGEAMFAVFLLCAFFLTRFRPYQIIYLFVFLVLGYFLAAGTINKIRGGR